MSVFMYFYHITTYYSHFFTFSVEVCEIIMPIFDFSVNTCNFSWKTFFCRRTYVRNASGVPPLRCWFSCDPPPPLQHKTASLKHTFYFWNTFSFSFFWNKICFRFFISETNYVSGFHFWNRFCFRFLFLKPIMFQVCMSKTHYVSGFYFLKQLMCQVLMSEAHSVS